MAKRQNGRPKNNPLSPYGGEGKGEGALSYALGTQRGFLLITAVILIVVVALLATVITFLTTGNVLSSAGHANSAQSLFLAESGIEYEQRRLAQNLDWYRSPDPIVTVALNLGQGTFANNTYLPATKLRTRMTATSPPAGNDRIQVYSVARFPDAGFLQIEEDLTAGGGGEFVQYTGRDTVNNRFTGITRASTVGVITGADGAVAHDRGSAVYPVTTLVDALPNNSNPVASLRIMEHPKFLGAGTLDVEGEELFYNASSVSGIYRVLTGVQRAQNGTAFVAHAAGVPVTPTLMDGATPQYEAEVEATGAVGDTRRLGRRTVQR